MPAGLRTDGPGVPGETDTRRHGGPPTAIQIFCTYAAHIRHLSEWGYRVIDDPAIDQAPLEVPHEAFLLAWSEFDYRYAMIFPQDHYPVRAGSETMGGV